MPKPANWFRIIRAWKQEFPVAKSEKAVEPQASRIGPRRLSGCYRLTPSHPLPVGMSGKAYPSVEGLCLNNCPDLGGEQVAASTVPLSWRAKARLKTSLCLGSNQRWMEGRLCPNTEWEAHSVVTVVTAIANRSMTLVAE